MPRFGTGRENLRSAMSSSGLRFASRGSDLLSLETFRESVRAGAPRTGEKLKVVSCRLPIRKRKARSERLLKFSISNFQLAICNFPSGSQSSPASPIPRQQFIRFLRPPRAGGILAQRRRRGRLVPCVFDDVDEPPRGLDFIAPGEKRRVAGHRVEQQWLI